MSTVNKPDEQAQQLSLFELLQSAGRINIRFSSEEIEQAIDKLHLP